MQTNQFKRPFQYEKIPLENISVQKKKRANDTLGTIKRLVSYLLKEKSMLIIVILLVLISSGLSLLAPYMIGTAIDTFIVAKAVNGIGSLSLNLLLVYLGIGLSVFLQNFWMVSIAQKTVFKLRADLFHHFHLLPISYYDNRQQGELMSRITNDIDNVNSTLNQSVIEIFSSILTLVGTTVVMLILSPILTAVTAVIIPLLFIGMRWITKRTGPLYKLQQTHLGETNGFIEETLSGQQIIKTFSQEQRMIQTFEKQNKELEHSGFWSQTISGFVPKLLNLLNFLSFALIALVGGLLAIKGIVTVGVIVIFIEYARQFTRPLNELSNQYNILLSAIAGAERVFDILDQTPEENDEQTAIEITETSGHIIFDHVSFGYDENLILKELSFEAKPGEMIAFVGHTGAGKTTIINLIARFYNYSNGLITLDGIDLKKIKRSSLRKQMAFVLQNPYLFNGTVKENIRYGRLDATDAEIITAAKNANAHTFISALPNGYETILDQDGSSVSQGQKQLITIARAFISEPKILILDEATSNIDTITELHIQKALKRLMHNRTSFVIAHRLNTVQDADQIIMLEHGEIIEQGNHQELIDKKGSYFQLYN